MNNVRMTRNANVSKHLLLLNIHLYTFRFIIVRGMDVEESDMQCRDDKKSKC